MDVTLRPFAGWDDLAGMRRLVAEGLRDAPGRSYVHPGDVSWWIGWSPVAPEDLGTVCRIWDGGGGILGWAFVDGDDVGEFAHPEVLDTAEAARFWRLVDVWLAAEHPEAARYTSPSDRLAVDRLRDAGYRPIDDGLIAYRRSLDDVPLAPTTRVRALRRDDDPTGRLRITKAAFGDERAFDRYLADYRRFMASPAYPEGWDLVAETDDGTAAASCIAKNVAYLPKTRQLQDFIDVARTREYSTFVLEVRGGASPTVLSAPLRTALHELERTGVAIDIRYTL